MQKTGQKTVPNVFVNGEHVGGCDNTIAAHQNGRLQFLLNKSEGGTAIPDETKYDYDLVVIGGGSGGLAASKVIKLLIFFKHFFLLIHFDFLCHFRKLQTWAPKWLCVIL